MTIEQLTTELKRRRVECPLSFWGIYLECSNYGADDEIKFRIAYWPRPGQDFSGEGKTLAEAWAKVFDRLEPDQKAQPTLTEVDAQLVGVV